MAEYCSMEEDWGLQAIVRACTHDHYTTDSVLDYNYRDDFFYDFSEFEELKNNDYSVIVNEIDDLHKPFRVEQEEMKAIEKNGTPLVAKPKALTSANKYKRKNQQKRVVVQVTAEGLSSDLWAWRKYGQKPIKGSPYPRSYYRCSSSKGCLARRQVEESCTDPGMFIITYSAEHNHAQPTRRSSLAGTNRQKFSASIHVDEVQAFKKIKHEKKHRPIDKFDEQSMVQDFSGTDHDHDQFVIPDSILADDFFGAFDELDGLMSNSSFYGCSSQ